MKNFCDNPICQKMKSACTALCKTRLKGEYSMNISVYNEDTPERTDASHKCEGKIDHALVKLVAVLGALAIFTSLLCGIRSLFRD